MDKMVKRVQTVLLAQTELLGMINTNWITAAMLDGTAAPANVGLMGIVLQPAVTVLLKAKMAEMEVMVETAEIPARLA